MRKILHTFLVLVIMFGTASLFGKGVHAQTTANQSHDVMWFEVNADKYQLYYNEVGSSNVNTVFNGLTKDSKAIKLNFLKPCTEYNWSLKAYKNGKWEWAIQSRSFKTAGGSCTPTRRGPMVPMRANVRGAFSEGQSYLKTREQNQALANDYQAPTSKTMSYDEFMRVTRGQALGVNTTAPAANGSCSMTASARVWINKPSYVTARKIHVYYGTKPGQYQHAVRDLSPDARELTIGSLNSCATYYYAVQVIDTGRTSHWFSGYKMTMWK